MKRTCRVLLVVLLALGVSTVYQPITSWAAAPLPVAGVTAVADDGNVPANTIDGSLATRWSAEGDGVWIRYDLGSPQVIGSVSIAWHKGTPGCRRSTSSSPTTGRRGPP